MRLVVAGVALRHYGIVVSLFRIVDMECAVAFLTVEAVLSAVFLYILKHAWVALSALLRCQRLERRVV
jgi:hypothetical protein